jgi:hypothetical protein
MRNIMKLSVIVVIAIGFLPRKINAQTTNYQVYSLFVVYIAKYTEWPSINGSEFNITVIGKSKVYDELVKQTSNKIVSGLPLKVSQSDDLSNLGKTQIIYLSDGKSGLLDDILKFTQGKSIIVVTEREGLYKKGATFSFVLMENNTLRFDMNNSDLEKRQIKVAKNLTTLANATL